jgi:hypothetical protein
MIYDRPIWALMQDAAAELSPPFTVGEIIGWFAQYYPKVRGPAFSGLANLRLSYAVAFISR